MEADGTNKLNMDWTALLSFQQYLYIPITTTFWIISTSSMAVCIFLHLLKTLPTPTILRNIAFLSSFPLTYIIPVNWHTNYQLPQVFFFLFLREFKIRVNKFIYFIWISFMQNWIVVKLYVSCFLNCMD